MAKRSHSRDDFDSPWKEALQAYLPSFLGFFFADIHTDVDWTRGYESLDKEFQQIVRRAKVGKCLADKLFKIWLKDGGERWLLIHIEIQGDYEKEFPERMFDYHVAARQLYNQQVVSLAVLCDDNANWRPTTFEYENWSCRLHLTFRIAKLLDFAADLSALERSDNPFGAVVLAHLQAQATRGDPANRGRQKLDLVKGLYRRSWTADDVRRLFRLIDWMMALPDEFENRFWAEHEAYEEETKMEYVTSVERIGYRRGLVDGIKLLLDAKFGREGVKLLSYTEKLDVGELKKFARFLKKAKTVDDVRGYFE